MAATYGLRKHLATLASADKPEAIAERRIYQEACRLATEDRKREYPVVSAENFEAADCYQKHRIAHWQQQICGDDSRAAFARTEETKMTKATHFAIESRLTDGRKVYRFVEGIDKKSLQFAKEQAGRFQLKHTVAGCRVFEVTDAEVEALRQKSAEQCREG